MSSLCCPTCWEFLGIIRNWPTDFAAHGHYPTLSQVELPHWLSEEVMTAMLHVFDGILLEEITTMMVMEYQWKCSRRPLQQC